MHRPDNDALTPLAFTLNEQAMANTPQKGPATLRTIAEAAGVSAMTVSLALRNHPRIPETTRLRIQGLASTLGYRPDPHVTKLMQHLRAGRKPGFQASLAGITTVPEGKETSYVSALISAARKRAEELGYGFTVFRIGDPPTSQPALQRTLRSRGIEAVLLLPVATPRDFTPLLEWSNFAVVATTYGVLTPQFHRVVPHQFGNALQICHQLAALGYRRIGLVLPAEQDVRVHHGFSAAVSWQSSLGGTEQVKPLIHTGAFPERAEALAWYKREKPDVILASGDKECRAVAEQLSLSVPGHVGFASATKAERSVFAGIDERPAEIGAAAVEQLASLLQRGQMGIPAVPKITMVDGEWMDGKSLQRVTAKRTTRSRS
jgi:DNA-binding LacI/PurR family transcriptional regulator